MTAVNPGGRTPSSARHLILLALLFASSSAFAQIKLKLGSDFQFCRSEITQQTCVQVPIIIEDPTGGLDLVQLFATIVLEGDTINLVNDSGGEYTVTNFRPSPSSTTGIANPGVDLANPGNSPASPSCGVIRNQATEGTGPAIDFVTNSSGFILLSNSASSATINDAKQVSFFDLGGTGFFSTTQDEDVLIGVLELPVIANPNAGTITVRATTNAEFNQSNFYETTGGGGLTLLDISEASITIDLTEAPVITTHPTDQSNICTGDVVNFSVVSNTAGSLSYQWQKDTVDIPGATNSSYSIANVALADAGSYRCVITNNCGSTTSNAASLTVQSGVSVDSQPQNASVCDGDPAQFSVTVSGAGPITYQWRKDTVNIGGATGSTYNIASASAGDEGSYDCLITSPCGTITSTAATLSVTSGLAVDTHPNGATECPGANVSFTVAASGEGSLTYQWRKDTVNLPGETSATLSLTNIDAADAGAYSCVIGNGCTTVTSNDATLTVNEEVSIQTQPQAAAVCPGNDTSFTVMAQGTGVLTYQWQKDTVNIPGATSATLNLTGVDGDDVASYRCVITNVCGSLTSNAANLTLQAGVSVDSQPQNTTVCNGDPAQFSVSVSGAGSVTYQWRKNTVDIPGATGSTYNIADADEADEGSYDCVINSDCGNATSTAATLTVTTDLAIDTQPNNAQDCPGDNASFTVVASGDGSFTYQWRKDTVDLPGETSATLSLANIDADDAGAYSCVVSNGCTSVTSNDGTLTVLDLVTIQTQPQSVVACPGENASFTVVAQGSGTLTYQWRKDNVNIPGATSATFSLTPVQAGDSGSYTCVVSGACDSATTAPATLVGDLEATITNGDIAQGLSVITLNSQVDCGEPDFSYSWTEVGDPTVLGTQATLALSPAPQATTTYEVEVTDATSASVTDRVTVLVSPISLDADGNGFNTIADLWFVGQGWPDDLDFDVDEDDLLTVLDLLYINLGDPE
ncbi:Immunoglobulin domain-containing protein [Sulfidibacter corallicola]|uniref:Immunoglobulin domain-containing protein n=1 Tax=Sulfidibacter corallicola TaxID=2818388 RepID=A0A8A4TWQ8_SULCO|nr:immunoglobulin domain-containing protein [Sulfidibacter corallicola]QTD53554.1 immunoglobulin domain-containing protein [Sulfidibacter corallicola]